MGYDSLVDVDGEVVGCITCSMLGYEGQSQEPSSAEVRASAVPGSKAQKISAAIKHVALFVIGYSLHVPL